MPLQATSGAASYDAFGGGVAAVPNYIEDVFGTFLYTGTGASQTITNGIDLSTKGGLVWTKTRTGGAGYDWHVLVDSARGVDKVIQTNLTDAESTQTDLTSFTTTGYNLAAGSYYGNFNLSGAKFASWTFREAPKFFDVVTFTSGAGTQTINHNLGSTPGMIVVKRTTGTSDWWVWHRSIPNNALALNTTQSTSTFTNPEYIFGDGSTVVQPTGTQFTFYAPSSGSNTYVAYLFAHNAGGFGLTGTDNVISCGSYTGVGGGNVATITLGYEPQWILVKRTDNSAGGNWAIFDNMRGMSVNSTDNASMLNPNVSDFESVLSAFKPTATGFQTGDNFTASGGTYIYIAIRRGPMKVPTSGTDVFLPKTRTGNGTAGTVVTGASWPMDALWISRRTGGGAGVGGFTDIDRLRGAYLGGANPLLRQNQTDAESTTYTTSGFVGGQTNYDLPSGGGYGLFNTSGVTYIDYLFRRSPSVFDEVCYTGTGSDTTQTHNLGVAPELVIIKSRSNAIVWVVGNTAIGFSNYLLLNATDASASGSNVFNSTAPTSTVFSIGAGSGTNQSGATYVAYLFATLAGVSKVGSYTGTATTLQIDCGFTSGARFVLIKRTDASGDWYVWDSARGIVSGNDSYLLLNSTAAEVTNTDYIDTYSAGFEISSTAPAAINASGGSFIFFAVA